MLSDPLEILADDDYPGGFLLLLDRVRQSYVDLNDPTHLEFGYIRALADYLDALPAGPLTVVHLGAGAATLARYVAHTRPGSAQTLVEADPAVVEQVRRRLPFRAGAEPVTIVDDARAAVRRAPTRADVVILDAFGGGVVPKHLTTSQFFAEIDEILGQDGLFAVNLVDAPNWRYLRRVAAGLSAVWPELVLRAEPDIFNGANFGNVVLAAGHHLPVGAVMDDEPREFQAHAFSGEPLAQFLAGAVPFTDADAADSPQPPDEDWRV